MAALIGNKRNRQQIPALTMQDTASYIAALSAQLGAMADAQGLTLVSSLLKLVSIEAARVGQPNSTSTSNQTCV